MEKVQYSVVIPIFNSESTLEELFERINAVLLGLNKDFEVIFVDDCSIDNSWELLDRMRSKNPEIITIIRLAKNFGQHNAILCGFGFAKGEYVITLDDDLQNPPEEILKLIKKQFEADYDAVYGNFKVKKHNLFRNFGSGIIQFVFSRIFKTSEKITTFRLLKKDMVKKIVLHKQSFVFIDGLIHWYTKFIGYTEVEHCTREEGVSGYTFGKLLGHASNLLFNFTTLPLRVMIYSGFLFSLITFILGIIFIIRRYLYNVPLGYTSIIVSLFFIASVFLWVMGIVGEYVNRIFSLQNDKPQYSIKEIK